jgi:hydrogenase maturation protease
MRKVKTLIAGIGNILKGDDGLGPFIIKRLSEIDLDEDIDIIDFGNRVYDLLLKIREYNRVIIIDALDMGGRPGEIYVVEPYIEDLEERNINPHTIDIRLLTNIVNKLGKKPEEIFIVGCQPKDINFKIGLSETVEKSIDEIINIIKKLIGS